MIEANRSQVKVNGFAPELLAELTLIVKTLYEEIDKETIMKAVEFGFEDDEEIKKEAEKSIKELLKDLLSKLDD